MALMTMPHAVASAVMQVVCYSVWGTSTCLFCTLNTCSVSQHKACQAEQELLHHA